MQFRKKDNFYVVTYITGPTHNYLALEFSKDIYNDKVSVVKLGEKDSLIIETKLLDTVKSGVNEANKDFNADFRIQTIQYVSDDTPKYDIYKQLAYSIIERIITQDEYDAII